MSFPINFSSLVFLLNSFILMFLRFILIMGFSFGSDVFYVFFNCFYFIRNFLRFLLNFMDFTLLLLGFWAAFIMIWSWKRDFLYWDEFSFSLVRLFNFFDFTIIILLLRAISLSQLPLSEISTFPQTIVLGKHICSLSRITQLTGALTDSKSTLFRLISRVNI